MTLKMIFKKLKPYAITAGIGLSGLLGAGTAKAEGLTPPKIEQTLQKTEAPENPAKLLTQKPKKKEPAYKKWLEWLIIGSEIGASIYAATAIHEFGHAITATALGHKVYNIKLYPHKLGDTWVAGSFYADHSDSTKSEQIAIKAGGMIATRLTAELIDGFMNHADTHLKGDLHPRTKQALAALYLMNRFEGTKYVLRDSIPALLNNPSSIGDVKDIVGLLAPGKKKPSEKGQMVKPNKVSTEQKALYTGLAGLAVLDTILDWDEIKDNWYRLWMIDTEKKKKKDYDLGLELLNEGVQANFTYKF